MFLIKKEDLNNYEDEGDPKEDSTAEEGEGKEWLDHDDCLTCVHLCRLPETDISSKLVICNNCQCPQ